MTTADLSLLSLLALLAFYLGLGVRLSRLSRRFERIEARRKGFGERWMSRQG